MKKIFLAAAIVLVSLAIILSGCVEQKVYTPEEVLEQKDALLGQNITVQGIAASSNEIACTLRYCPPENPCCNSCGAALVLKSKSVDWAIRLHGEKFGCSGNECGLSCSPLEKGKTYKVTGIWNRNEIGAATSEYFLETKSFELVSGGGEKTVLLKFQPKQCVQAPWEETSQPRTSDFNAPVIVSESTEQIINYYKAEYEVQVLEIKKVPFDGAVCEACGICPRGYHFEAKVLEKDKGKMIADGWQELGLI